MASCRPIVNRPRDAILPRGCRDSIVYRVRTLIPALLLCAILALLSQHLQAALRRYVRAGRLRVFVAPVALSTFFCTLVWSYGVRSPGLMAVIAAYTFAPALLAYARSSDFLIILILWLPLEFAVGAASVPKPLQGFFHTVAYGIAILLALWIFLIFRELPGMKYNLPSGARDLITPLIGYALVAPVLIPIGLWLSFIQPFHVPPHLALSLVVKTFLLILVATAFPEEILFRALIQNSLMQKLGFTNRTLLLAAVIFGCAHLNNGPGPLPNWRYAIMATIAGFAYGKVFQKSSSVFSSAILHALINTSKHVFF
jgi:membrane protease YdiL (CAAX protease family)